MSQVINALKTSDQGYRFNTMATGYQPAELSRAKRKQFRWYHGLMLIAPSVVTVSVLSYQSYQSQQESIQLVLNQPAAVEQVSAPVEYLPYPQFGELKSTYVTSIDVTSNDVSESSYVVSDEPQKLDAASVAKVEETKPANQKENDSSSLDLEQLDLSGLSPALAMRVESALKSNEAPSGSVNSKAQSLLQNADKYSGRLPAMDFQTHVYASSVSKRWIKMNGVEYHEGDELMRGVKLVEINPQTTLVQFEQQLIEIPALYHWQG